MRKILALFLIAVMTFTLFGCASGAELYAETAEETERREAFEASLRNLYPCPTGYMFEKYMEPLETVTKKELEKNMSSMLGGNVKFIGTSTLFKEGEFTVYDVTLVLEFSTGEREIYHDNLITRENSGKQLVVLQETLDGETQKALMTKRDKAAEASKRLFESKINTFCKESKPFKEWYKNRKKSLEIHSSAINMLSEVKIAETVYNRGGRTLVWSEEFENVNSLDDTKMKYKRTMNNNSLKITTDDSNLSFQDGTMTMYARPADGKYHYSVPDGVTTFGSMAYVYGYLEMRAKVPFEHGAWPGFWQGSYAGLYDTNYAAEVDIFEVFSDETSLACNLHKWGAEHYQGGMGNSKKFSFASNEEATDWHTFGLEWTQNEYRFYIDGVCYCILYIDDAHDFAPDIPGMDGFHDFHVVMLNCFIFNKHSNWAPEGSRLADDETKVIEYTVDYIRLYQNKETDKIIIFQ